MKLDRILRRLKLEFLKVNLIQASLDSIILFLSINLTFFLLNIKAAAGASNLVVSATVATAAFLIDLVARARTYNVEIYEEENPELDEILRTARDNQDRNSIASQALFNDLEERAGQVSADSIIPDGEIIRKVGLVGALSLVTVFSGFMNLRVPEQTAQIIPEIGGEEKKTVQDRDYQLKNASSITGEPTRIQAEARELNFDIQGSGESTERSFTFSGETGELSLESSGDRIQENRRLAEEYSLAIKDM